MTQTDIDNIDCNQIRYVFRLAILVPKAKRNTGMVLSQILARN
jgi:hypothetical protein